MVRAGCLRPARLEEQVKRRKQRRVLLRTGAFEARSREKF